MKQAWWARAGAVLVAGMTVGCGATGPATGPGATTPSSPAMPADPGKASGRGPEAAKVAADPFALPDGPRDDAPIAPPPPALSLEAWKRASSVPGVAPAPKACVAFASRAPAKPGAPDLVTALAEPDPAKRDALLVAREAVEPPGLVRALRAELAPTECGDVIVDPFLKTAAASALALRHTHALVGLSIAAKLARTALSPPTLPAGAGDKESVKKFVQGPLRAWVVEQSVAIETLGGGAAGLVGYGRGVAAIEAGHADLRLVDQLRSAPTPKSWDAELKSVYEVALDEALEPRKQRGRDAVLVGLWDLSEAGVVRDARVSRARALLSKLYAGRLVDALDTLALPPVASASAPAATPLARASTALPVFWVDTLGGAFDAVAAGDDPAWLSVLATRGIPRATRAKLRGGDAPPAAATAYARARFELGRVSLRRVDFVETAHAEAKAGVSGKKGEREDERLVLALALALVNGPDGAKALMTAPGKLAGLRETGALDAIAAEGGPHAALAAFDAAFLRALAAREAAPAEASAAWRDVAARYRKAAPALPAPRAKEAEERATEADAAAKLAERPKS